MPASITLDTPTLKASIHTFNTKQRHRFIAQPQCIQSLLKQRSDYIDTLLVELWQQFALDNAELSLFAVGGYGRQELHPLSDIDLLIVSNRSVSPTLEQRISQFITTLWDIKLVIGHSVRTLEDCVELGKQDLTIATSLLEARLIIGDTQHAKVLNDTIMNAGLGSSYDFFSGKLAEQQARHHKYNNTANNLEPDIKSSPGGLRDIQMLGWIARRQFGSADLQQMSSHGMLTTSEYDELAECLHFLWRVRFALHLVIKRPDDRLTFAHQQEVALLLGFSGQQNQATEQMMKNFYRTLGRVIELNQMLIALFAEQIAPTQASQHTEPVRLDANFQRRANQIETCSNELFSRHPEHILTLFLHLANDDAIDSIAPPTLRQLRTARRGLTEPLSTQRAARQQFIALLCHPNVFKAIPLMHKHGVLAAYLSQWHQIVGQMQFDLFHAYTVDEHTVRLLKHIASFKNVDNKDKHPICCELFPRLTKPQLLILAAIFHDIAKGRNGDHSELGAVEAYQFCLEHELTESDARLVSWLVQKHLIMSITAQRRDIYDPEVIQEFAQEVRSEERINYLICLTVADICATNPTLWNSWKRTLLAELYHATINVLRRGHNESFSHVKERIRHNKAQAKAMILAQGFDEAQLRLLWKRVKAEYFLRHSAAQIAWHCSQILLHDDQQPLVVMTDQNSHGSTEIFIYAKDKTNLFAQVVTSLDRKNLSVHDAQIMTSKDGYTLDSFIVLDAKQQQIASDRYPAIIKAISQSLVNSTQPSMLARTAPQKLMAFRIKPQVRFLPSNANNKTLIELVALDVPGLLAKISLVFTELNISLQAAKITTTGETAEDFFILSRNNLALDEATKAQLQTSLLALL